MPAIGFICPDGDCHRFEECFAGCPIYYDFPAGRCMALRNLRMIAEQRPWTGKPSCTQLLKGTREAFLEITKDYYFDPQDAIFRIIGTKAHAELDKFTGDNEIGEIRLEIKGITGAFDYYESGKLYDSKTYGSYKVMQCLGLKTKEQETGEAYKSGARKGQPKKKKIIVQGEPELTEQELQMNLYRMMLEDAGFPVKGLFLDVNVRDGNTVPARQRGIMKNAYLIPIPKLPDDQVLAYFLPKRNALLTALETGEMPPECSLEERWEGRKCERYCHVAEFCQYRKEDAK